MHTLFFPDLSDTGETLVIEGDEARHAARVKRLQVGEMLRVINGKGDLATCRVVDTRRRLELAIVSRERAAPVTPAAHVWSATPKGARVEELVDALAQVGAASWTPMSTKLGVVDPRETKLARLDRIVLEASKQAARPWLLRMEAKRSFQDALGPRAPGESLVICDGEGEPYRATGASAIRVLVGPEGGFTADERALAARAGAVVVSLGPHTMRIEMAAPVAVAVILHAERAGAASRG